MGTLVTLDLPAGSPVADLPWVITIGSLGDEEDWEPVVCGPYERAHALALAQAVVADEDLMAVVEPLLPRPTPRRSGTRSSSPGRAPRRQRTRTPISTRTGTRPAGYALDERPRRWRSARVGPGSRRSWPVEMPGPKPARAHWDSGLMVLTRRWAVFLTAVGVWTWVIWPRFGLAIYQDRRSFADGAPTAFLLVHMVLIAASLVIGTTVGVLGVRAWRATGDRTQAEDFAGDAVGAPQD